MRNLPQLTRYKSSIPFSRRFNDWVADFLGRMVNSGVIDGIDFTDNDEECNTFELIKEYYDKSHRLIVWKGASDSSIFGNANSNALFRAWHDLIHIMWDFDFTLEGESQTAFKQASQLPNDWAFERELIMCEVIGQVLYFNHHNEFPTDQRAFTIGYLTNGDVRTKY